MPRLKLADLQVSSFETSAQPSSGDTLVDTQQMDCWSPLCMDTYQRDCPQQG
ncbi:MAG TPA: hypothetical protein VF541_02990 [Longimicrobium sp.]